MNGCHMNGPVSVVSSSTALVISLYPSWAPAYSESQWATRYIPLQIDTPLCRLNGLFDDRNGPGTHA